MSTLTEIYTGTIAGEYLSTLINGDYSGLSDDDESLLDAWYDYHFAGKCITIDYPDDDETNFTRDDVTGLMSDCVEITVYEVQ